MKEPREIVYHDELNDEFSTAVIKARKIDENYNYGSSSFFWRLAHFFVYRVIGIPVAWLYLKIVWRHKIVNKGVIKPYRKSAFFLYGNHTSTCFDPLVPAFVAFPKPAFVIVHPANVSIPFLGKLLPFAGALPLPDTFGATRNFMSVLKIRAEEKSCVAIYPEAHIWPYCIKIRNFSDASFAYPVKFGVPTFSFTNTYQKSRFLNRPKVVTYVDGPFFCDESLGRKEAVRQLRDKVHAKMTERSLMSNVEIIRYVKGN